ncbi:NADH dehydrogenase [ubiquinone] 1 beta subcomplex subunit 10 [Galendromus occidentalis]|uniref:NADH dehydrogenase [ubiquinone] 1 beta subcomplex subunit 10 n=1 Tax=Galendromus occidentalis TaxID=34638 RepID=A0AAJ6VX36_9ACAR|nr:NADH dehydrogenase [ubiquinone] 1 beta subcomplex subunit 10 [Galendromus occidentalis]
MRDENNNPNFFARLSYGFMNIFEGPATFIREKVVLPNRGEPYPWYHRKFPRVKDIDQCYMDDFACIYEAEEQFLRDRKVDSQIVRILRRRREDCYLKERPDHVKRCAKVIKDFEDAEVNLFIKYGDMGIKRSAQMAFMKQKHRLVMERRKRENYTPLPPKYIDREDWVFRETDFQR